MQNKQKKVITITQEMIDNKLNIFDHPEDPSKSIILDLGEKIEVVEDEMKEEVENKSTDIFDQKPDFLKRYEEKKKMKNEQEDEEKDKEGSEEEPKEPESEEEPEEDEDKEKMKENSLKEGMDSIPKYEKEFQSSLPSDIIGSLYYSILGNNSELNPNKMKDSKKASLVSNILGKLDKIYGEFQDLESRIMKEKKMKEQDEMSDEEKEMEEKYKKLQAMYKKYKEEDEEMSDEDAYKMMAKDMEMEPKEVEEMMKKKVEKKKESIEVKKDKIKIFNEMLDLMEELELPKEKMKEIRKILSK